MKIEFTAEVWTPQGSFFIGETHDLPQNLAMHYLSSCVAKEVIADYGGREIEPQDPAPAKQPVKIDKRRKG